MEIAIALLAVLIGLSAGAGIGFYGRRLISRRRMDGALQEASTIIESARDEGRAIVIEAKENVIGLRSEWETELRDRRAEIAKTERRLGRREENLEKRSGNLDRRESQITKKERRAQKIEDELEDAKQQSIAKLEEISELSLSEARDVVMREARTR